MSDDLSENDSPLEEGLASGENGQLQNNSAQADLDALAEDANPEDLIAAALAANSPAQEPAPEDSLNDLSDLALDPDSIEEFIPDTEEGITSSEPDSEPSSIQAGLDALAEDANPEDLIAAALAANSDPAMTETLDPSPESADLSKINPLKETVKDDDLSDVLAEILPTNEDDRLAKSSEEPKPSEPKSSEDAAPSEPGPDEETQDVEVKIGDDDLLSQDFLNAAMEEMESSSDEIEEDSGQNKDEKDALPEVEINLDEEGLLNEDMVNAALENAAIEADIESEQELEKEGINQADVDAFEVFEEIPNVEVGDLQHDIDIKPYVPPNESSDSEPEVETSLESEPKIDIETKSETDLKESIPENKEGESVEHEEPQTLDEADADMAASLDEIMNGASPLDDDFDQVSIDESANFELDGISLGDDPIKTQEELDADVLLDQYASDLGAESSIDQSDTSAPSQEKVQGDNFEESEQYYQTGKTTSEELESQKPPGMSKSLKLKLYALAASFVLLLGSAAALIFQPQEEMVEEPYTPDEKLFPEVADVSLKFDKQAEKPKNQENPTAKSNKNLPAKAENMKENPQPMASLKIKNSSHSFSWTLEDQKLALRAAPELSVSLALELQSSNPQIARIAPQYSENMESILRNIFYFTPRNKLALPEIRTRILRELQFLIREGQIHAVQIKDFELQLDASQ